MSRDEVRDDWLAMIIERSEGTPAFVDRLLVAPSKRWDDKMFHVRNTPYIFIMPFHVFTSHVVWITA